MKPPPSYSAYADVLLDVAVDKLLSYGLNLEQASAAKRGMRVEVPLRGKPRTGYIYAINESSSYPHVAAVSRFIFDEAIVTPDLFDLALWMSKYYCVTLQQALQAMLPASVRNETKQKVQLYVMRGKTREALREHCINIREKAPMQAAVIEAMLQAKKGLLLTELLETARAPRSSVDALAKQGLLLVDIVRIDRSPLIKEEYFKVAPKPLNGPQEEALAKIAATIDEGIFSAHLLYGITGSGKTEVYMQAIEKALAKDKSTIMLVPEIALTAQTIERFRSRFEGHIAVLHHRLSQGERLDEWQRIQRKDAKIVIGARSAVFSPVQDLGLIIVDEEHESSYKQTDTAPCYNARDVAVMRAKMQECCVLLGSATPSLESYYNAKQGKYALSTLGIRADSAMLPNFRIVDMKRERDKAKGMTTFSDLLLEGIKKRQSKGEQTILFLNRRGYHTMLLCSGCEEPVRCAHCAVSLTFHLGDNLLACHLCGFSYSPPPKRCPSCSKEQTMKYRGIGTELVERSLHAILPDIRTLRLDADTTRHKGSHQRLLRDFGCGKADVLIGTQMIAKGLHFPQVTLVGVLNGDASLQIPDFRASETAFQLITQVAGRAGRGALGGEVIVQTMLPDNETIQLAAAQDYVSFYESEIASRELFQYPPFAGMVKVTFSGKEEGKVRAAAETMRLKAKSLLPSSYTLHPVVPAGYAKVKDQFRFQMLIIGPAIYPISLALKELKAKEPLPRGVFCLIDVNPTSTFF